MFAISSKRLSVKKQTATASVVLHISVDFGTIVDKKCGKQEM